MSRTHTKYPPVAMTATRAVPFVRRVLRVLLVLLALVVAYLGTVAIWSWASIDEVMSSDPVHARPSPLSGRQTEMLLKIEDPTFLTHSGLSLADGQGFTTISSSVARDVLLSGADLGGFKGSFQRLYRGIFACCKKLDIGRDVMALVLNAKVSKQDQLKTYIAKVYMGTNEGVHVEGLEQASNSYFGKPLNTLTEQEFAGLVAMIKAPNQFHPVKNRAAYDSRLIKVKAIISGKCKPDGWFDTSYEHCENHP
jgi:membrane carboxypeptidase/penicillin-binding protein PbpC